MHIISFKTPSRMFWKLPTCVTSINEKIVSSYIINYREIHYNF